MKGTFTSVWDDGTLITTPATLNKRTGEVTTKAIDTNIDAGLKREYFSPADDEDDEIEVCTTCHSHILKPVMNPGMGHDLNEEPECMNPDCESHL